MAYKSKIKAGQKYNDKNNKQINIRLRKEEVDFIYENIKKSGMSKAAYIGQAIKEKLERDGYIPKCRYELLCDDKTIYSTNSLDDAEKRLIYETEFMGHNGHYEIIENELK